jgi:CubicO group peptidase (beta-lactamase class C family)
MRRSVAVFWTALVVAGVFAQTAPSIARDQPAPAATSSSTPAPPVQAVPSLPAPVVDGIDRLAIDQIHAGRTPGIAIGVVEDGRLVYARGFGFATLSPHAPMTPDTEFYAGGLTMQFTAAAILLAAQDGKLKLDDFVTKYVPEFHLGAGVTIQQLLTQTSGLPSYASVRSVSTDPTKSVRLAKLLAAVDKLPPAAPPGTVHADNPLNYFLAALVLERATGVPLSDYLEQHIFIPLVMNHTFLAGDSGISSARATGYTRGGQDFTQAPNWDPAWLDGDAGLVSTVDDLAKWDIEMPVLLRVDSVRAIFTPGTSTGPTRYGMGWVIDRRGGQDYDWSNGQISGYRAMNAVLPTQHVGVIVLSNADSLHGSVTIPEAVGAHVLDILAPPPSALDNAVITKAKEWLERLATHDIDRAALTPAFSAYLTDDLVARENFAALGTLQVIVPISSTTESNGDTLYEFLVRYPHAQYHYDFELAPDGKIDGITLIS